MPRHLALAALAALALGISCLPATAQPPRPLTDAAAIKGEVLEEAEFLRVGRALQLLGASPDAADRLLAALREMASRLKVPIHFEESPIDAVKQTRGVRLTPQQSTDTKRLVRGYYTALMEQEREARSQTYAASASCSTCDDIFDWCVNYTDNLLDQCDQQVSDPAWCLQLYRQLLHTCLREWNQCIGDCSL